MTTTNELKAPEERGIQNNRFGRRTQVRVEAGNYSAPDVASLQLAREGPRGAVHYFNVPLGAEDLRRLAQICLEVAEELNA
jgi:hypothetical protein